ncbi:unnamed protein product [Cylindrotheca closterium]|uniref:RING-type domain-containing protein n=1 Tax=Cylindrotheca closterium TaxID=2856 RepID=A0AAD2CW00_9STRA|nr:unnamed protein product [Cylindrotheca closterium]
MTDAPFNLKNTAVFIAWFLVVLFATIGAIIRKRRSRGQTTVSPLDLTRTKKEKRCEVAQEILFLKVEETTTKFKKFRATTTKEEEEEEESDIEKGQGQSSENDKGETDYRGYLNACAICLDEFQEGEMVVRSVETKECQHIFHEACMKEVISALTRKKIVNIPCPCCRQSFVEIDEIAHA